MYARSVILLIPQKKMLYCWSAFFRDASLLLYKGILPYTTKVLFIVHNVIKKRGCNINMAISFIPSMPALMHPEQANPLI
jgi:hypothetical protein